MISLHDLRGVPFDQNSIPARAELDVDGAIDKVRSIVEEVRDGGEEATLSLCEQFDGIRPASLRVPADDVERSLADLDPSVRASLEEAIRRIRKVHRGQRRDESRTDLAAGASVTMRWLPVDRVGLYVPGGRAVYPSSVLMNVIAAQEAGVRSLAIASPPQKDFGGLPHPTILAAAAMLGVNEIYAVGGAQAIAMFAYGVRDSAGTTVCEKVDLVTGPGNVWVAAAKRLVKGIVGIDSEAGPTEITVLADDSASAEWIAADLISQAEHDVLAASVLITTSHSLALSVIAALEDQVPSTKHELRIREALGGRQSGVYVVSDLDAGLKIVNVYAAEHLEIHTRNAATVARKVTSAGAVFVGPYSPVSLGDYCAGSNHVLPTGGNSLHSSGLSVQTFLRGVPLIEYDRNALREVADHVVVLSEAEDLPAHGQAVVHRFLSGIHEGLEEGSPRKLIAS